MRKQATYALIALVGALLGAMGLHILYLAAGIDLPFNWRVIAVVWVFVYSAQQWPDVLSNRTDNQRHENHDDAPAPPQS